MLRFLRRRARPILAILLLLLVISLVKEWLYPSTYVQKISSRYHIQGNLPHKPPVSISPVIQEVKNKGKAGEQPNKSRPWKELTLEEKRIYVASFIHSITKPKDGCMELGVDYVGADIDSGRKSSSAGDCQKQCQNEHKCKFWAYNGVCYLKKNSKGKRAKAGVISGPAHCLVQKKGDEKQGESKLKSTRWRPDGKCGPNNRLPDGEPGQCNAEADKDLEGPCCSSHGFCGNSKGHCECQDCVDYRKTKKWRDDGRCGINFKAPNGEPGQCDPDGWADKKGPCCSKHGYCGNSDNHCKCKECVNYGQIFRTDGRCGANFKLLNGLPATCNPNADKDKEGPCCSKIGWCGNSPGHCDCVDGCVDYRKKKAAVQLWRIDGTCGSQNPLPDGRPGQCNPNARADQEGPCCSKAGWCGNSDAECKCEGCVDYRKEIIDFGILRNSNPKNLELHHLVSRLKTTFRCTGKPLKVLIMVLSRAENWIRRRDIRNSYANNQFMGPYIFFVVGKPRQASLMPSLTQEIETHGDIITGDVIDDGNTDSLKVEMALEWALKYCKRFKFLLKTGDDTFIHTKNLFKLIETSAKNPKGIYSGQFNTLVRAVPRNPDDGHIADILSSNYNGEYYPPYVSGTTLFSYDVVEAFVQYFFEKPFNVDDLYLGFLAINANITATDTFGEYLKHGDGADSCEYDDKAIGTQFVYGGIYGLNCMIEFYYLMLAHNPNDVFLHDHYYKVSPFVMDQNKKHSHMAKDYHGVHIDYRYIVPANNSNLDKKYHVGKLISSFPCHTKPLKVIVMLLSHPSNDKRRQAVRSTWGKTRFNHVNDDFRVFFVVGKVKDKQVTSNLLYESEKYKDIIFGDFYESFYNNSWKLEMMFEYGFKHCTFDYLLKVDDDNFVHLPNIFKLIAKLGTGKKIYMGRIRYNTEAMRYSKYRFTYEEYHTPKLPPLIAGGAVLMSYDLVRDVIPYFFLGASKPPMKLEDVYTGFLVLNAGAKATHSGLFRHSNGEECAFDDEAMSLHFWQRKTKDEIECMKSNYKTLLDNKPTDPFVRTHYLASTKL